MTVYDSIERGSVDEVERRRPRTFTLTQLLVACVAVCVCVIAATTVVKTHRALANADDDQPGEAQLGFESLGNRRREDFNARRALALKKLAKEKGKKRRKRAKQARRARVSSSSSEPTTTLTPGVSSVFTGTLGSCAFVANNPTLPMGGGPKIDAHDTVVRFNNFWERRISDERTGVNVDVLVTNANKGPDGAIHSEAQREKFIKRFGGKCFIRNDWRYEHRCKRHNSWRWSCREVSTFGCETIPQAVYDACLQGIRHKYNNLTHPFPTRIVPTTGMLGVMHIGHRCASIALYGFTLPEPPYPTFPQVPHLYAEEHAALLSAFPKAVFI